MGHEMSKVKRESSRVLRRQRLQMLDSLVNGGLPKLPGRLGRRARKHKKILILSLDAAGKTTLLEYIKTGKINNTIPTVGYNHEEVEYKRCSYSFWDVGGQDGLRQFWIHYFFKVNGIIFLVDSADRERLDEAYEVFMTVVNQLRADEDNHTSCPILVVANKQDLPNSLTKEEVYDGLHLNTLTDIKTAILKCSIVNGVGIDDILQWLHKEV